MRARHLPVLDGLRALAVLLVLWGHVPEDTVGYPESLLVAKYVLVPGGLGVEIFFVLSGFLITRILLAERAQQLPVRWFLLRRLLRIFPIYYLLLVVMLPFRPADEIGWCALYLYNLKSIFWPAGGPLEHTWSLCVEEHFYLLWPLAVAFLPPRAAPRLLLFFVMPVAIVGAFVLSQFVAGNDAITAVQRGSPFRFLGLGAGSLLAFREMHIAASPRRAALLAVGLTIAAIGLHPYLMFFRPALQQEAPWIDPRYGPVVCMVQNTALCTGCVLLAILAGQRWPHNPLTWPPLRGIGRISYGLYLYHLPIYYALVVAEPTAATVALGIAASFAAAIVSYFAIEAPILRFAARFRGSGTR